jgi:hypothetical protein
VFPLEALYSPTPPKPVKSSWLESSSAGLADPSRTAPEASSVDPRKSRRVMGAPMPRASRDEEDFGLGMVGILMEPVLLRGCCHAWRNTCGLSSAAFDKVKQDEAFERQCASWYCFCLSREQEGIVAEAASSALSGWENFYVIVGSSAGALTGLQFVVIALIAEARAARSMLEIRAFGTPTVVHFCAALLVSVIVSAPWRALSSAGIALGICGAGGIVYVLRVIRHARTQTGYAPDAEDWAWYTGFPLLAYAALLVAGVLLARHPDDSLFLVAGAVLGLLFVGIHNAWDSVTYIALEHAKSRKE